MRQFLPRNMSTWWIKVRCLNRTDQIKPVKRTVMSVVFIQVDVTQTGPELTEAVVDFLALKINEEPLLAQCRPFLVAFQQCYTRWLQSIWVDFEYIRCEPIWKKSSSFEESNHAIIAIVIHWKSLKTQCKRDWTKPNNWPWQLQSGAGQASLKCLVFNSGVWKIFNIWPIYDYWHFFPQEAGLMSWSWITTL